MFFGTSSGNGNDKNSQKKNTNYNDDFESIEPISQNSNKNHNMSFNDSSISERNSDFHKSNFNRNVNTQTEDEGETGMYFEDSGIGNDTNSDSEDDSLAIEDFSGNKYSGKRAVQIMLEYKKDTKDFSVGDLQRRCNKKCRRLCDRWYPWTKELMERVDKNEIIVKEILKKYSHAHIQALCRRIAGDEWNKTVREKTKSLMNEIEAFKNIIKSDSGMDTIWGKIKLRGNLQNNFINVRKRIQRRFNKKNLDIYDYAQYKLLKWKRHYKKIQYNDEKSRFYTEF